MAAGAGPLGRDPRGTRDRGRSPHGTGVRVWQVSGSERGGGRSRTGAALAAGVRTRSPPRQQACIAVVKAAGSVQRWPPWQGVLVRRAVRTGRGAVEEARRAARQSQGEVKLNDVWR